MLLAGGKGLNKNSATHMLLTGYGRAVDLCSCGLFSSFIKRRADDTSGHNTRRRCMRRVKREIPSKMYKCVLLLRVVSSFVAFSQTIAAAAAW